MSSCGSFNLHYFNTLRCASCDKTIYIMMFTILNYSMEEKCQLHQWGFPDSVIRRYHANSIMQLFPWQVECLLSNNGKSLTQWDHLIYTAPTRYVFNIQSMILVLFTLDLYIFNEYYVLWYFCVIWFM
jgi:hypothetical protein